MRHVKDDRNFGTYLLFSIITCGIYTLFWLYKQGNRIQNTGRKYGLEINENGTTLLLWPLLGILLCGFGSLIGIFVSYYYFITNINKLCIAYNRKFDGSNNQNMNCYNNYNSHQSPAQIPVSPQFPSSGALDSGELQRTTIPFQNQDSIIIGRDPSVANIVLNSKDISRRHCEIQYNSSDRCYYICDYSSYGLRVNGQQIQKNTPVRCNAGSKISLANRRNEFILK